MSLIKIKSNIEYLHYNEQQKKLEYIDTIAKNKYVTDQDCR